MRRMTRVLAPILVFMLAATMLAEIGSGNLPPSRFFQPAIGLPLITIGYGIPLLLLREIAVGRGFPALVPLGLAYGLINEGFLAKTLFLETGVPIPAFDGYGMIGGVNASWLVLITWWHLVNALLGPLALTHALFPAFRDRRWISNRVALALAGIEALACIAIFFSQEHERGAGSLAHFTVTAILVVALVGIALRMPAQPALTDAPAPFRARFLAGLALFVTMTLTPFALAEGKVPLALYFGFFALAGLMLLGWVLRQARITNSGLLALAMGNLAAQSLWLLLGTASRGDWERVGVALLLLGLIALAARLFWPAARR